MKSRKAQIKTLLIKTCRISALIAIILLMLYAIWGINILPYISSAFLVLSIVCVIVAVFFEEN
jgi:hypothetical protein